MWRDDLTVLDCGGHDWVADTWFGQTWATLRSGQFFDGWSNFLSSDSRLRFVAADFARGWNGVVVDGAIEPGIVTARSLLNELAKSGRWLRSRSARFPAHVRFTSVSWGTAACGIGP